MAMKRSAKEQAVSGLRIAGLIIPAASTAGLLIWGGLVVTGRFPGSVGMAWAALAAGFAILIFNLNGFAKMLPGFLALATLNAVAMAASGHVLNDPSTPVSRTMAIGTAVALGVGSVLSARFHGKHLSLLERVVLVVYVGLILVGFVSRSVALSWSLGTVVLAIPWVNSRIRGCHPTP
jgi:hypothetical protein